MTARPSPDWMFDFGLDGTRPPHFFATVADLDAEGGAIPQAHVLRRAFEELDLSGILCQDGSPIVYFRTVDRLDASEVMALHRTFWNQGVAPILALVGPDEVHIYSGLSQPAVSQRPGADPDGLVERLDRVAEQLRAFLLAVETGEYYHRHRRAFDPRQRVDRNLLRHLEAARELLADVPATRLDPASLDALLCRVVFTCYLFDRKVIDRVYLEEAGIHGAEGLADILGRKSRSQARVDLYALFSQLGEDFNGDLFSEDLEAEARQIRGEHLDILGDFIQGTDPRSRQRSFWPYEFGIIPIETISAIYEHFLKAAGARAKREAGAFYTPRFLAELVIDSALDGGEPLLGKRFLDPACGSGIFLVGLFNRLAEEWARANPKAGYDAKIRGLTAILKTNLFGVDKNRTACLIAAFSLYLAFLDQLSPPDIRRVLKKVKVLPRLVAGVGGEAATIRCADFFADQAAPDQVDYVIGNPPWAEVRDANASAATWCAHRKLPFPAKQLAAAFVWKAPEHLAAGGSVCLVLPYGLLFNHTQSSVEFQRHWFKSRAVDRIMNLADFQRFLFEDAEAPALVVRYGKQQPAHSGHRIQYWSPKTDWAVTQAEVISILPQDRACLSVREVLDDLRGDDAPLIWKERYWATSRDRRLLDRLRLYPRLRDVLGQRGKGTPKRWIVAEGYEPFGANDPDDSLRELTLHRTGRIERTTHRLCLLLLPDECGLQETLTLELRRAISNTDIFKGPLVLIKRGYSNEPEVAFANFNVAYRHGIRGIHGPAGDADLLAFLTFYLRSSLARYFLFHTSASWGVSRATIDIDDLMRLPFPLPDQADHPNRAAEIVAEAGRLMAAVAREASDAVLGRDDVVRRAQARAEPLIEEYFDVDPIEQKLVADTVGIVIPSVRPTRARIDVPALLPARSDDYAAYIDLLCSTLNGWANAKYRVHGKSMADCSLGIGMVVLRKARRGEDPGQIDGVTTDVLAALQRLQKGAARGRGAFELARGLKVFDGNLLYVIKPVGRRFWSATAALNDADEIAGTILMRSEGDA
ncbi:N-6 DNA methylase [Tautonia sociabilis]|uniref:site-specific DNA-methyltransferase (adenine-specific) n=1 Tax=Tautonia sociabilis TaxID=2080755 RepID=A0A432MQD5_9BACT|nr:N-6 DNA methylase [Tautonia sociabilis]RUL89459.1 type I restriction endonuclease subunit M [Tautonia sociabilis]